MLLPKYAEQQVYAGMTHTRSQSAFDFKHFVTDEESQRRTEDEKEQHVWLIRYGKTAPGLIENVGNYDSDLHSDGVVHAKAIAQHIAASGNVPDHVFADPFLRCTHTADTIVSQINRLTNKTLKVKIEEGLTEWQVPSLLVDPEGMKTDPRTLEELVDIFDNLDELYESVTPQGPDRESG